MSAQAVAAPAVGFDPALLIGGDFVLVRTALLDALGGDLAAAVLLQRIAWRCERSPEGWRATREELRAETHLSEWQLRKALKALTDRGWLTSRRTSRFDSVQIWQVHASKPATSTDAPPPRDGGFLNVDSVDSSITDNEDSSMSSLEDIETSSPLPPFAAGPSGATEGDDEKPETIDLRDKPRRPRSQAYDTTQRPDVNALCQHLVERIVANGSRQPEVTYAWRKEARNLLDLDKVDPEEAHRLIDWCQRDHFWRSVIVTMGKFREKYDTIRLKASSEEAAKRQDEIRAGIRPNPHSWIR